MNLASKMPEMDLPPAMKWALGASVVFHLTVIIGSTVGLPYIKKPIILPSQPIAVEIVNIEEETKTNKRTNQNRAPKPKEEKSAPKKNKITAPPKVETKAPPKVTPLEPPKPIEHTVKPKPKVPPPPKEKLEKPEEKKPEPKQDDKKEVAAQEEAFLSVLKNLQDAEPDTAEEAPVAPTPTPAEASPLAKFSQKLSASEVDAIRVAINRQFSECWNLMAGARYAEDIVVKIRLVINPNRSVQSARVADQWRYNSDSFYKAAADSALRALEHPNCAVLDLPPDKYELWKDMVFNFNPAAQL